MKRFLLASASALGLMTNAAMAQSSGHSSTTEETTTITPTAAPWTTSTGKTNGQSVKDDGRQSLSNGSSSSDSGGKKTETTITNTSYPLTDLITTTRTTVETSNGVATETVTTTQTYPPSPRHPSGTPPVETTTTRSYVVGAK
jgi:opacity protein-like surface antigen